MVIVALPSDLVWNTPAAFNSVFAVNFWFFLTTRTRCTVMVGIENPIPVVDTSNPSELGMYSVAGTVEPFRAVRFTGNVSELAREGDIPNEFMRNPAGMYIRKFARFRSLTPLTGALK
jgi:hypothetical protein